MTEKEEEDTKIEETEPGSFSKNLLNYLFVFFMTSFEAKYFVKVEY